MNSLRAVWCVAVLRAALACAFGQCFTNLDFESAAIRKVPDPYIQGYVATVFGWRPVPQLQYGSDDLWFNDVAMDSPAATLHGASSPFVTVLQGNYSLLLQGGSSFYPWRQGQRIAQTGQVPSDAQSMTFWAAGTPLSVTFNGLALSVIPLRDEGSFVVYGADIADYAGLAGELEFTRPWTGGNYSSGTVLDNIEFMPSAVPEPSFLCLAATAGALWGLHCIRAGRSRGVKPGPTCCKG